MWCYNYQAVFYPCLTTVHLREAADPWGVSMRHYEIVLLIQPDQGDQIPSLLDRYQSAVLEAKGKVHRVEEWGRFQLAYPITTFQKAFYVMINIEVGQEVMRELVSAFTFNDMVIRHLVITKKQPVTGQSEMMEKVIRERQRDKDPRESREPREPREPKAAKTTEADAEEIQPFPPEEDDNILTPEEQI